MQSSEKNKQKQFEFPGETSSSEKPVKPSEAKCCKNRSKPGLKWLKMEMILS